MRKIALGDTVKLTGHVTRVGEDGLISVRLDGYAHPVSLYEEDIADVIPAKEPKRKKPLVDNPDRGH